MRWVWVLALSIGVVVLLRVFAIGSRDGGDGHGDVVGGSGGGDTKTGHRQAHFVATETKSGSDGVYSGRSDQLVPKETEIGADDGTGGAVGEMGRSIRPSGLGSVSGKPKQVIETRPPTYMHIN